MPRYSVKINIIEYGRTVEVEAESRAEARRKIREGAWDKCGDESSHRVQIVGSLLRLEPPIGRRGEY